MYRILKPGEVIRSTDLYWNPANSQWVKPYPDLIGTRKGALDFPYLRPVLVPAPDLIHRILSEILFPMAGDLTVFAGCPDRVRERHQAKIRELLNEKTTQCEDTKSE